MSQKTGETLSWAQRELSTLDLGDQRLDSRAKLVVQRMIDKPMASIPQATIGWGEAKGVYRFLSNDAVEAAQLRRAVTDACIDRVAQERVVLAIQDTTSLDFTGHPALQGAGPLGGGSGTAGNGIFVHSAIAVSEDGVPLGLLHQEDWVRSAEIVGSRHERKKRPIEDKESHRWIRTARAVRAVVSAATIVVHVADREADIFELLAEPRQDNEFILVRAYRDRCLAPEEQSEVESLQVDGEGQREPTLLLEAMAQAPATGEYTMVVRRSTDRPPRDARMQVAFRKVRLKPPCSGVHDKALQPVTLTAISVQEIDPPTQEEAVHWLLLTDLPIESSDDARECVRRYSLRWLIERYHFTLKSGCQIEDTQVRTIDRLQRLLALYCVVALRLLWITYAARVDGEQPCTVAFSDIEWKTLCRYHEPKHPLPETAPPLRQAARWTAQLGGFLARKSDGEPGVKALWRGLTRLHDIVIGVLLITRDPLLTNDTDDQDRPNPTTHRPSHPTLDVGNA